MSDYLSQFQAALSARGLVADEIVADGKMHRCDAVERKGEHDGSYLLYPDGLPAGGLQNWRDSLGWQNWHADIGRALSPAEAEAQRQRMQAAQAQRQAEESQRQTEAQQACQAIWDAATPAHDDHPYLQKKGVKAHGLKVSNGRLLVPLRDTAGVLHSLQFIDGQGQKRFKTGGRKKGCSHRFGKPCNAGAVLCIAEGYATAASIHEATGYTVAVAFDAGSLPEVAQGIRAKLPEARIVLCADDDYRTKDNPGLTKAKEAAAAIGGLLAIPDFGAERPEGATDFNDLAQSRDKEAVKAAIAAALERGAGITETPLSGWPAPLPLTAKRKREDYPVEALPDGIRAAIEEVTAFVQAPLPLAASCALASLSLACQAYVDVERAPGLQGPVSLFLLTIAESGERKSTCDGHFTQPLRDYQRQQAEALQPKEADYRAELAAWEAKANGLKEAIRTNTKNSKASDAEKNDLCILEREKPQAPKIPKLFYNDATPEALNWGLAHRWPSAGMVSAEAGSVFGAHGMKKDSIVRNLSSLNLLWDGKPLDIERKTSESFSTEGARLTVGLQVQEATLREFHESAGALARGIGFYARYLLAWPESTQGTRFFREAQNNWPALTAFQNRIQAILAIPAPMDASGILQPVLLKLTPEAKAEWVYFHDTIESMLGSDGELSEVRDVASKAADNAARLAALFHCFAHGATGAIGAEDMERASQIVT